MGDSQLSGNPTTDYFRRATHVPESRYPDSCMANSDREPPNPAGRNGKPLRIPLPFEEAIAAALEVKGKPDAGEPRPPRRKKKPKTKS